MVVAMLPWRSVRAIKCSTCVPTERCGQKNEALSIRHNVSLTTPSSSPFCLRLVEARSDACTLVGLLLDAQGNHHSFP